MRFLSDHYSEGSLVRGYARAAVTAVTAGLLAVALASPAYASDVPSVTDGQGHHATVRGTSARSAEPSSTGSVLQAALLKAKAARHTVPVPADTTQTSTTVALADGKLATTTYVLPVRIKQNGSWIPVNATLHSGRGGLPPGGDRVGSGAVGRGERPAGGADHFFGCPAGVHVPVPAAGAFGVRRDRYLCERGARHGPGGDREHPGRVRREAGHEARRGVEGGTAAVRAARAAG